MAIYLMGDVQGCDQALDRLLVTIGFSPSRDVIYLLGDLVNRGPDSAAVLRRLMRYGSAAQCILGNHDLHLLASACGARKPSRRDTLDDVLQALDRHALLEWLSWQPLARQEHGILMVHAGVLPSWDAEQTLSLAAEVQSVLRGTGLTEFLFQMYGNYPTQWSESLRGMDRLRVVVNALTRLRFCTDQGHMDFESSEGLENAPAGLMPWFDVPGRRTIHTTIAFGHWSRLGWLSRDNLLCLDTGCVWGGQLSACRIDTPHRELIQVQCPKCQNPKNS